MSRRKKGARLVIDLEDQAALERIKQLTKCESLSGALSLLLSRCLDAFLYEWKMKNLPIYFPPAPTEPQITTREVNSQQVPQPELTKKDSLPPLNF